MSDASAFHEVIEEIRRDSIRKAGTSDPDAIFPMDVEALVVRYIGRGVQEVDDLRDSTGTQLAGGLDFDHPQVLVNGRLNLAARRFTIAHELAHYWFHEHLCSVHHRDLPGVASPAGQGSTQFIEWEANAVAGAVLVPPWALRHYIRRRYGTFQIRTSELTEAERSEFCAALPMGDASVPASLTRREVSMAVARASTARGISVEPLSSRFRVTDLVIAIELERDRIVT